MESELCTTPVQYPSTNVKAQPLFLFLTDDKRRFCMVVSEHLFLWFNGKSTSWENRAMGRSQWFTYCPSTLLHYFLSPSNESKGFIGMNTCKI